MCELQGEIRVKHVDNATKKWEDILPITGTMDFAKHIAQSGGHWVIEVRFNHKGSLQGHYYKKN